MHSTENIMKMILVENEHFANIEMETVWTSRVFLIFIFPLLLKMVKWKTTYMMVPE